MKGRERSGEEGRDMRGWRGWRGWRGGKGERCDTVLRGSQWTGHTSPGDERRERSGWMSAERVERPSLTQDSLTLTQTLSLSSLLSLLDRISTPYDKVVLLLSCQSQLPSQTRPLGPSRSSSSSSVSIPSLPSSPLSSRSPTTHPGESAVGKSSVVLRFCQNDFQANKEPTIGA
jgi:hypothetical protein